MSLYTAPLSKHLMC